MSRSLTPFQAIVLGELLGQAQLDGQGDEMLLRTVVDVPLQSAPLGILRGHDPLSGGTELERLCRNFAKSRLPFAAIITGRTRFAFAEFQFWQVALAVAFFAGVIWLHGIIGPPPLWVLGL